LLDRTPARRVLADAKVCPVNIVVGDEGADQLAQVALVQDDDVVEQFAANRGDEALGDSILPRAPIAGARRLHPQRPQRCRHPGLEDGTAVEDHEAQCRVEGKGLAKLLCGPGGSRVRHDGAVGDDAPAVADDKTRNVTVGTEKKSMAAMPFRWFRRKVIQAWPDLGARGRERR
jgi:hypothetical protein